MPEQFPPRKAAPGQGQGQSYCWGEGIFSAGAVALEPNKMQELPFADNEMFKFYLKINHVFIEEEDNPSNKVAIDEEEIDGIAINGIGNLVDLPRLMLINEESGNLEIVVDGEELTRNNNIKKKSEVLQAYRCQLREKYSRQD